MNTCRCQNRLSDADYPNPFAFSAFSAESWAAMSADEQLVARAAYDLQCCDRCGILYAFEDGELEEPEDFIPFQGEPLWQQLYYDVSSRLYWTQVFGRRQIERHIGFLFRVAAYQQHYLNDLERGTGAFLAPPKGEPEKCQTRNDLVCHCGCRLPGADTGQQNGRAGLFYALTEKVWGRVYCSRASPTTFEELFGEELEIEPLIAAFEAVRCRECSYVYVFDSAGALDRIYRPDNNHLQLLQLFPEVHAPKSVERAYKSVPGILKQIARNHNRIISLAELFK